MVSNSTEGWFVSMINSDSNEEYSYCVVACNAVEAVDRVFSELSTDKEDFDVAKIKVNRVSVLYATKEE